MNEKALILEFSKPKRIGPEPLGRQSQKQLEAELAKRSV